MSIFSILTSNNLSRLLQSKNCTLEELKVETILIMVHNLLQQYLNAEDLELSKPLFNEEENVERKELLLSASKDILEYLEKEIISITRIRELMHNAKLSDKDYLKSTLVEPYSYYYDVLTKQFQKDFKALLKEKHGESCWMPDVLAFSLIIDIKEKSRIGWSANSNKFNGYNLNRFKYLDNYDFNEIIEVYNVFSKKINKENGKGLIVPLKEGNLIQKSRAISLRMINAIDKTKYKVITPKRQKMRKKKNGK